MPTGSNVIGPPGVDIGSVQVLGADGVSLIKVLTDGSIVVEGNVASGAADSGNPVKVGGRYNATQPTLTDGQRGDVQLNTRGELVIALSAVGATDGLTGTAGTVRNQGGTAVSLASAGYVFNGSTLDRIRSDGTTGGQGVGGTVADSAANAGNPVLIGATYLSAQPTYTTGQRTTLQADSRGNLRMSIFSGGGITNASVTTPADAFSNSTGSLTNISLEMVFNGTTWDRARSDGNTGGRAVGGTVASGSADSGNPVKVGGRYNATLPTLTDGQRGDLQVDTRGAPYVVIKGNGSASTGAATAAISTPADASNQSGIGTLLVNTFPEQYNGSTWDRQRTPFVFKVLNAVSISTETTIWTPASGKKFRLMGFLLSQGTLAGNVVLKDNTGGTTVYLMPASLVNTPVSPDNMGNGILSAAANNVLTATGSATQTLSGTIWGTEE